MADQKASATRAPKNKWPEVVGLTAEEAQNRIKQDMGVVHFQVVPQGNFVTMDHRPQRVRIFIDPDNKVSRPPRIG
ncbi:hypothetical protein QJS10_CPB14g00658 [Acorus calamus]|uniref:Subtilisin inhibitor 1 n=1 Tax=Acorus calamus TaxID=4465 RepID=A0AAV9DDJ6_ACOCL|nr:hypothetical protein QJS10_CPB14g00658 [Acorus calamus]